ncbi:restriction endonuclease subunit S [Haemophilus paraphrohaemolyticus]
MNNWKELPLNDVIELVIDHRGKTPKKLGFDDFFSEGYPVLSAKHVKTSGLVNLDAMRFANEEMYKKWMKEPTQKGDVILTSEAPLGELFYIDGSKKYVLGQRVFGLRPKSDVLDSMYLLVWLSSAEGQGRLQARATGSTVQGIKQSELLKIMIPIPPMEVQKDIASIYGSLDKEIQLNTQINQTLEQIAQALFKSWFVDFDPVRAKVQALSDGLSLEQAELATMQTISGKTAEELTALSQAQPDRYAELAKTAKAFPCEMVEVDGGEVPKGWELSTIGDCYDVVMGQSPKGETYNENKQGMLFYQGRAEFGWRFPTPRLFTTDPKRIAEQNSILMSVRAPVGDINIALEKCCIGRGLAALQHKSKSLSFGLYQIQSIKPELDLFNGEGTVFGSINQANLKNIQIINPDEKFIQLFEKYLSSCDSKIMNNEIENNALKEIRDLLLPRLLSGEIQL